MSRQAAALFPGKPLHVGRMRALIVAIALVLGLGGAALVKPDAAGASIPPRTALENSIAWAVKKLINTERALHGLRPLYMNTKIQLAARRHNLHMAEADEMSHQLPGEPYFGRRIINAGYDWTYAGENIAWNSDMSKLGVLLLERLMYREKPPYDDHRLNILSKHYRAVGVDVYMDNVHHKVWLTTDFGRAIP